MAGILTAPHTPAGRTAGNENAITKKQSIGVRYLEQRKLIAFGYIGISRPSYTAVLLALRSPNFVFAENRGALGENMAKITSNQCKLATVF